MQREIEKHDTPKRTACTVGQLEYSRGIEIRTNTGASYDVQLGTKIEVDYTSDVFMLNETLIGGIGEASSISNLIRSKILEGRAENMNAD